MSNLSLQLKFRNEDVENHEKVLICCDFHNESTFHYWTKVSQVSQINDDLKKFY